MLLHTFLCALTLCPRTPTDHFSHDAGAAQLCAVGEGRGEGDERGRTGAKGEREIKREGEAMMTDV